MQTITDETRRRIALSLGPITTGKRNRRRSLWKRILSCIFNSPDFKAII